MTVTPAAAQVFTGQVVDADSRRSVAAAVVSVLPAGADSVVASAVSGGNGVFSVRVPTAGRYRLRVEHIAFGTLETQARELDPDAVVQVELALRGEPVALAPLDVRAERLEPPYMQDIRDRMALPWGKFLTREDLAPLGSMRLGGVLGIVPGVRVRETATIPVIEMLRSHTARLFSADGSCRATLYIGGARVGDEAEEDMLMWLRTLTAHDIEAVEVYRGVAELPAAYGGSGSHCGVVALWFRHTMDDVALHDARGGSLWDLSLAFGAGAVGGQVDGLSSPGLGWATQVHWRWRPRVWLGVGAAGTYFGQGTREETGSATGFYLEPRLVWGGEAVRPFAAARAGVARRSTPNHITSWGLPIGAAAGVLVGLGSPATELEVGAVLERTSWGDLKAWWGHEFEDTRAVWYTAGLRVMLVRSVGSARR
ncbi:MAG: carboxypeptidase-like regulatory domain-containing protein [Gemmatimonadota bacterium]